MQIDPIIQLSSVLILASILAHAAFHKLKHPTWFLSQLESYDLLPTELNRWISPIIPVLEVAIALTLLIPASRQAGAIACCILMLIYAGAIIINIQRGKKDIDCGCSGPAQSQPLRWVILTKNLFITSLSGLAIIQIETRNLSYLDAFITLATGITVLFLYSAIDTLFSNSVALKNYKGA